MFSFDRSHAFCRVETNPEAFAMDTHELGRVTVEPHAFFMSMEATSIEQYEITTTPDGGRTVRMRGGLDCSTEIGQAEVAIGSRTATEHATYLIEAVDGGVGGWGSRGHLPLHGVLRPRGGPRQLRDLRPGVHLHRPDGGRGDHHRGSEGPWRAPVAHRRVSLRLPMGERTCLTVLANDSHAMA